MMKLSLLLGVIAVAFYLLALLWVFILEHWVWVFLGTIAVVLIIWLCIDRDQPTPNRKSTREPKYDKPTPISSGNIKIIYPAEMNVFLRYYHEVDIIKTKVKGVTFRNDDGTDRQNIITHCHRGDQLRFKAYEYHGAPAYAVYCDWGQIGNLSAELAEEIAAKYGHCILLGEILNVSGGYHGEYFGCNICVTIYEKD